ncbi:type III secretion HrpO family protein [Paraburkholderia sp. Clong3]
MPFANNPIQLIALLFALSLLPLIAVMGTSFLKLSIVLSMLRNALGIQQIPPNIAIYGLSLILTAFIMAPVGIAISDNLKQNTISTDSPDFNLQVEQNVLTPYRTFLAKQAKPEQVKFFAGIGKKMWPQEYQSRIPDDSLVVLMPAFVVSPIDRIVQDRTPAVPAVHCYRSDRLQRAARAGNDDDVADDNCVASQTACVRSDRRLGTVAGPTRGVLLMSNVVITQLTSNLLWLVLLLSLPVVAVASIVGGGVSLIQVLTQVQDQTIQFLIKLVAVCITLVLTYHWMGSALLSYTIAIFDQISMMGE